MISIQKNAQWKNVEKLFDKNIIKRYNWFLFEFGKRITRLINDQLLDGIDKIKGSSDYKKRLKIAELKASKDRSWFAIVARAETLSEERSSAKTFIIKVVNRFNLKDVRDPVKEILETYGPWTMETIPFVPFQRQAQLVIKTVDEETYLQVLMKNEQDKSKVNEIMASMKLERMTRASVKKGIKVVTDLTIRAMDLEFKKVPEGKPHWRPALRYGKTQGVMKLMMDKELIKAMTDPKFLKWRSKRHLRIFLTQSEYKQFEKFQKAIIGKM